MKRNTRKGWIGLLSLGLIAVATIVVVLTVFADTNDTGFTATGYSDVIRFQAEGVATLQVQIYDLSGKVAWDSSVVSGNTIDWDRNNDFGERLAYGAYLYSAQGWNASGDLIFQKNGKLALMPGDKVQLQAAPVPNSTSIPATAEKPPYAPMAYSYGNLSISGNLGIGVDPGAFPIDIRKSVGYGSLGFQMIEQNAPITWRFEVIGNTVPGRAGNFEITELGVANHFAIAPGGNVGIGTTNPDARFHVYNREPGDLFQGVYEAEDGWAGLLLDGVGDSYTYSILGLSDHASNYNTWLLAHKQDPTNHQLWFHFFGNGGTYDNIALSITPEGHVGIGAETNDPTELLAVGDVTGEGAGAILGWSSVNNGIAGRSDSSTHAGIYGWNTDGGNGVYGWADGDWSAVYAYNEGPGCGVWADSLNGQGMVARSINGDNIVEAYDGKGTYDEANDDLRFYVERATGDVYADGTFHPGGADMAELLPAVNGLEPGDVLVINSNGKLALSTEPYQATVAGVYSTEPGILGSTQESADTSGKIPLAVVGVIPVKASAENGPIHPGDCLTTSNTPGYSMRANPITQDGITFYPSGVIIGKALESLEEGNGLIQMVIMH